MKLLLANTFRVPGRRGGGRLAVVSRGVLLPSTPADALPVEEVQSGQKEWKVAVRVRASIGPYLKQTIRLFFFKHAGDKGCREVGRGLGETIIHEKKISPGSSGNGSACGSGSGSSNSSVILRSSSTKQW